MISTPKIKIFMPDTMVLMLKFEFSCQIRWF